MSKFSQLWQRTAGFLTWAFRQTPEDRSRRKIGSIPLRPGQIALDCGANVGAITRLFARWGADVHAFEPNPYAFRALTEATKEFSHVLRIPAAVDAAAGKAKLYFHQNSAENEVLWSNGSSLLAEKGNVSKERFTEVEVIDLADYILKLDRRVSLLKLDVEGAECRILRRLIDSGAIDRVDLMYVEMHDQKIPELREESDALRRLVAEHGWRHVHLDWV